MVRGGVDIFFHTLDTGGRGQGQNIMGGVDYVRPNDRGEVHSFQTLTAGNFFHASLTHI